MLASGCCVAPLLLALAGISGAWIGQLRRIAPYSPWLTGLSLIALGIAGWRLFRRPAEADACSADGLACRRLNGAARRWFGLRLHLDRRRRAKGVAGQAVAPGVQAGNV